MTMNRKQKLAGRRNYAKGTLIGMCVRLDNLITDNTVLGFIERTHVISARTTLGHILDRWKPTVAEAEKYEISN